MNIKCPCNSLVLYRECCQKAHKDIQCVKTAEELMRSRYTAFVFANGTYLQQSHHSSTKPTIKENRNTIAWSKSVNWISLEVLDKSEGEEKDSKGTVEFKAYFYEDGEVNCIHENSFFIKENGVFKYHDKLN